MPPTRRPDFLKLWAGQTVSEFGTVITRTAMPLVAILTLGAEPKEVGLLVAAQSAGVLAVGVIAGVWADRLRRRPVLIASDLARAVLLLWVPFSFVAGTLRVEQLYAIAFLVAVLSSFFESAYRAYLPGSLIGDELTLEGNARLGTSSAIAEVGGPGIAGALVQVVGPPLTLLVDAASYLVSAVSLGTIRAAEPARAARAAGASFFGELLEGLWLVARDPILRPLAASTVTRHFFGSFIGALYALYVLNDLGLSPLLLGLLVSSGGVGSLVGSIFALRVSGAFGLGRALIASALVEGLVVFLVPLAGGSALGAALFLLASQLFGDALLTIHFIVHLSLRQLVTEDRIRGRVNATLNVLEHGVAPLGALAGAALAVASTPRATLYVAAVGILASGLWLVFSRVRSVTETSPASPSE